MQNIKGLKSEHVLQFTSKLDGVCPVDNRPSTDEINNFVPKKEEEKREKNLHMTHGI